jgi:hypothetical protein
MPGCRVHNDAQGRNTYPTSSPHPAHMQAFQVNRCHTYCMLMKAISDPNYMRSANWCATTHGDLWLTQCIASKLANQVGAHHLGPSNSQHVHMTPLQTQPLGGSTSTPACTTHAHGTAGCSRPRHDHISSLCPHKLLGQCLAICPRQGTAQGRAPHSKSMYLGSSKYM